MSKLKEARELIRDKCNWTTHQFARDSDNNVCDPINGCKFCALGALMRVHDMDVIGYRADCQRLANAACGSIVWLNDRKGHGSVMEMYDRAIKELDDGSMANCLTANRQS